MDNDTTLRAVAEECLTSAANSNADARHECVARLKESFQRLSRDMGHREWTREDLHAR